MQSATARRQAGGQADGQNAGANPTALAEYTRPLESKTLSPRERASRSDAFINRSGTGKRGLSLGRKTAVSTEVFARF